MADFHLDMLRQIAFGSDEYLKQLLEAAVEDLEEAGDLMRSLNPEEVTKAFALLHKTKTTLSMLQAGDLIQRCQVLLAQAEAEEVINSKHLDTFVASMEDLCLQINMTKEQL